VTDAEELENGTNPLIYNEPPLADNSENEDPGSSADADRAAESEAPASDSAAREGLERFTKSGALDNTLSSITTAVERTRTSLDDYREKRSVRQNTGEVSEENTQREMETSATGETATITRHQTGNEKIGVFTFLLQKLGGLLSGLYTLILFLTSKLLAHPALVQLLLLVGVLYGTYRLARRLGRRPIDT
jgi:hypothetical protein